MIFNKPARNLFLKYDGFALHDKQLLILTFIFGQVSLCYVQSMSYRVHSNNTVGLRRNTSRYILLKDLIKFIFDSKEYRRSILQEYFEMQVQLSRQVPMSVLVEKKLFSATEIDEMKVFQRKRWFWDHFKPFHMSKVEGLIRFILF